MDDGQASQGNEKEESQRYTDKEGSEEEESEKWVHSQSTLQ